jgi:hypothetical protein
MTTSVQHDQTLSNPNTWAVFRYQSGFVQVVTRCGKGHIGSLDDHQIDSDGFVTPSVVCQKNGCDYHEFIRLEGWEDGIRC